jgi:hypothetical protein
MEVIMLERIRGGHVVIVLSQIEGFEACDGGIRLLLKSGRKLKVKGDLAAFGLKWFHRVESCPFVEMCKQA